MDRIVRFTTDWITDLASLSRCEFRDMQVSGLVLRVGPTSKVFYLYKRVRLGGRSVEKKVRLGTFPALSLASARRLTIKLNADALVKKPRGSIDLKQGNAADEELLTTAEAARLTKMSCAWFERMRWEGQGPPYYRAGRAVRYIRSELIDWWKSRPGS